MDTKPIEVIFVELLEAQKLREAFTMTKQITDLEKSRCFDAAYNHNPDLLDYYIHTVNYSQWT